MSTGSVAWPVDQRGHKPGEASTSLEWTAERVEVEIARLREMRPALSARIDRAATILVNQLSLSSRTRPVRVRVAADGRARFLVSSANLRGAVYTVSPTDWSCTCPDYHRRGGEACKHAIACYVLWRLSSRPASPGCAVCVGGWVYLGEPVEDAANGGEPERVHAVRCTRCWRTP